jgi:cysteine sulfinate desulfinase/cysteine desulfurase-like protein/glyoxylase-like metal-dependent hydrolase (beta-lactamase superfamily II)/rhodanese-related sulfurtransferase
VSADGSAPSNTSYAWQAPADLEQVYFDCNATTPTLPLAARAALGTMQACFGNPSSAHVTGLQAKHLLEQTRALAREAIGACPGAEIVFTSGATEGIQMAVFSALHRVAMTARSSPAGLASLKDKVFLYGATEHKAVPQALYHWSAILDLPVTIEALPVDTSGRHDLAVLRDRLPSCLFLATMAVNNETGVVSDLAAIDALVRSQGDSTLWLVDCVQALGKFTLDAAAARYDYATFSGHKLYAPKGIGFLYARPGAPLVPLIVGGGQERGIRSGTENLPGVAAFGEILRELVSPEGTLFANDAELAAHRDSIARALREHFPGVVFNAPFEATVPTTLNFSIPGFSSKEMMDLFDAVGIRLSAGSACSAAKAVRSAVLDAMGVPEWRSLSALRLSFGPATPAEEIQRGVRGIERAARALKESCFLPGRVSSHATPTGDGQPEPARTRGVVQFPVGAANSWVLAAADGRTCVIIDPCEENAGRIVHFIECQGLRTLAVLDTHLHADHLTPRASLEDLLGVSAERDALGFPASAPAALWNDVACRELRLSSTVSLLRFPTPGHTAESVSFLMVEDGRARFLFTGDLVLPGGLGRTNFPTSDASAMFESLRTLARVAPDACLVCPAHDYSHSFATLWGIEKASNPLLELALDESHPLGRSMFLAAKREFDQGLLAAEDKAQGIVCGVVQTESGSASEVAIPAGRFRHWMGESADVKVFDVREPWEWTASVGWDEFGFASLPENIPLSRFVNLVGELLAMDESKGTRVALLCRSGTRAVHAARSLRRLGFRNVWSLEGGLAYGLR